ncbi:GYDIA family GHMP kinase [Pontimicrobium sp. MEBiC06410]
MQNFYSNGKLLLTGEYVVLDGAKALAVPTKYGQTLSVENTTSPQITWKSIDNNNVVWFETSFLLTELINDNYIPNDAISKRLFQILRAAKTLNPNFLTEKTGYSVFSKLDFPRDWGLGSSSTLLNNIAQWATVDPFKLSDATFGGSGYDIACAFNDSPILYYLEANQAPNIEQVCFNPNFKDKLHFVHLNQKQNSRDAIKTYQNNKKHISETISKVNIITNKLNVCETIEDFEFLITSHESLIGEITNQTPIKSRLFNDFNNAIKSLGGWGGDFILATGSLDYVSTYFKSKGYNTIISYSKMVL